MSSAAASVANTVALPARTATTVRVAGLAGLCAASLVAPALILVWMPIVLGVPHVANDVRYLVLPLPRRQVVVALLASALLVAMKAASLVMGVSLLRAEMVVVAGWLLVALALGDARRSHAWTRHAGACGRGHEWTRHAGAHGRRHAWWIAAALAAVAIVALPVQFAIVAAMAHNAVAVIAWLVVRRPDRQHALIVVAAIGAAVVLLVLAGPAVAGVTGGDATRWLTIDRAASFMFGGLPLPLARGLVIAFAFLQAVHYAVWLDWIPRGATAGRGSHGAVAGCESREETPRRRLARGAYGALAAMAGTAVVIGAAFVDPTWARTSYLALASFHIYLELVVLAVLFVHRPLIARTRDAAPGVP